MTSARPKLPAAQSNRPGARPASVATGPTRDPIQQALIRAAVRWLANSAGAVSRMLGHDGKVLPGRIALALLPTITSKLATGRSVTLVSGTNGKTTTTALLVAALSAAGAVATNASGANMLDGITAALLADTAPQVAVEVDEQHLPAAIAKTHPAVVVLVNLSRDQLDRVGETRRTADRWREALTHTGATVIANCDDPLVTWAARAHRPVVWVSAGIAWDHDRRICPACEGNLVVSPSCGEWHCPRCGAARPEPQWAIEQAAGDNGEPRRRLRDPGGAVHELRLALPGAANAGNATLAVAAAHVLGLDPATAIHAARTLRHVAGRYLTVNTRDHRIYLLLAKNPASWSATLKMLEGQPGPVVIAINAAEADGRDTSWLYDVAFDGLAGRTVIAAGNRAADLGTRLTYAGVPHTTVAGNPLRALRLLAPRPVTFVGDYTSFRCASQSLRHAKGASRAW